MSDRGRARSHPAVADRHDRDAAGVYRAVAYSHEQPEEMARVGTRRTERDERIGELALGLEEANADEPTPFRFRLGEQVEPQIGRDGRAASRPNPWNRRARWARGRRGSERVVAGQLLNRERTYDVGRWPQSRTACGS